MKKSLGLAAVLAAAALTIGWAVEATTTLAAGGNPVHSSDQGSLCWQALTNLDVDSLCGLPVATGGPPVYSRGQAAGSTCLLFCDLPQAEAEQASQCLVNCGGTSTSAASSAASSAATVKDVVVNCTSAGQVCSPSYTTSTGFTTGQLLQLDFTASPRHCSDISVSFAVDGVVQYTSPFLAPGGATGVIDLGPVSSGMHTVAVQATGRTGGCNRGALSAWTGTLDIVAS